MWLVIPLIYFMSWRSCRDFGQAITETAAWIVGYLATAALIVALNVTSFNWVSDAPDGPGVMLALIGGFVGMGVSRYLWKRRGGHLNRKQVPWMRVIARTVHAVTGDGKTTTAKRAAAKGSRSTTGKPAASTSSSSGATRTKAKTASGAGTARKSSVAGGRQPTTADRVATATARGAANNPNVRKAMSNRWVKGSFRALDAMLTDPKTKKTPPRK